MKILLSLALTILFVITSFGQSKTITKEEYDKAFQFAVEETNEDFPLIFTVITEFFENDKITRKTIEVNENEARGQYRIKRTLIEDGKETNKYQISYGGNVFCSDDGMTWTPPSPYECPRSLRLYGPRDIESEEFSVTKEMLDGKMVKVYRKYTIFSPLKEGGNKEFDEKVSTIDSRGFFITVVNYEGTLDPKTINLKRTQSWNTKAKFKKIIPPDQN